MVADRRDFLKRAGLALAAPFVLSDLSRAAPVSLRLHHALPATDSLHASFLIPWASSIREASGGQLDIQMLPAMQLGGLARQLTQQVRDGVVDMAWVAADDARGEFPRMELLHLPFVGTRTGFINSQVAQEIATRHAAAEFPDLQPLIVAAQDQAVIHATKPIGNIAELKGARLCPPTWLAGGALQALGAIPVWVADPHLTEAFAQNVLDGSVASWSEASVPLQERAGFHAEVAAAPAFCTAVYLLLMNKARFDGLAEDLRRILLERSGLHGARLAGHAFDARAGRVVAGVQERGGKVVQLAEDEKARWVEATRPVTAAWVERVRARGVDGNALLAEVRALFAEYEPPAPPPPAAPAPAPVPDPAQAAPAPAPVAGAPAAPAPVNAQPASGQFAPIQQAPIEPAPLQPAPLAPVVAP